MSSNIITPLFSIVFIFLNFFLFNYQEILSLPISMSLEHCFFIFIFLLSFSIEHKAFASKNLVFMCLGVIFFIMNEMNLHVILFSFYLIIKSFLIDKKNTFSILNYFSFILLLIISSQKNYFMNIQNDGLELGLIFCSLLFYCIFIYRENYLESESKNINKHFIFEIITANFFLFKYFSFFKIQNYPELISLFFIFLFITGFIRQITSKGITDFVNATISIYMSFSLLIYLQVSSIILYLYLLNLLFLLMLSSFILKENRKELSRFAVFLMVSLLLISSFAPFTLGNIYFYSIVQSFFEKSYFLGSIPLILYLCGMVLILFKAFVLFSELKFKADKEIRLKPLLILSLYSFICYYVHNKMILNQDIVIFNFSLGIIENFKFLPYFWNISFIIFVYGIGIYCILNSISRKKLLMSIQKFDELKMQPYLPYKQKRYENRYLESFDNIYYVFEIRIYKKTIIILKEYFFSLYQGIYFFENANRNRGVLLYVFVLAFCIIYLGVS